jgi:competence protein ComEC
VWVCWPTLLAIPWVTLVVTPLAMLGTLYAPLWAWAAGAVDLLGSYLQLLAALPFATLSVPAAALWAGAAGVLGGLLLVLRLPWQLRMLGVPLLLPVLLWQAARPAAGEFELLVADIGQGNAVLVRTASHSLLYDAGPRFSSESDAGNRVLLPLLRAFDEKLDTVLLSHRDTDHIGGAQAVLAMQPQAALLSSIESSHPLQAVRRANRCVAGQRWAWDGVEFEILHPQATDYDGSAKSNALSCVLRIAGGGKVALLVGDIEAPQETRLVASGAPLKADFLLAPHHGSKTSSSAGFLDAVQPPLAVAQVGYRNRFGHPAPEVQARYQERGIALVDSPRCGAMLWLSDAARKPQCQRGTWPHYWQHQLP